MIIDAHIHCSGEETTADLLRMLDEARVDVGVFLAPFLSGDYTMHDREALKRANRHLGRLVADHGDRMVGFAVVNPALAGAASALREAVERDGLRGLKLVPSGWYPYDEAAHAVYAEAQALGLPILFHSGIFIDGRSGRFCRPVFFEAVREHPGLRVTLAHLGWPWSDEANAVGLIDLLNGVPADECQFRFDLSFGPPHIYRRRALEQALEVLTPALLQFGSDRFTPCSGERLVEAQRELLSLLDDIGVGRDDQARIMGGTAAAWLGRTWSSI